MATPPITLVQGLTLFAGVMAVASLVITAFFVHDRRHRLPGLLLSTSLICMLVGPLLSAGSLQIALICIAIVLVTISGALSLRSLRRPPD